ncbi:Trm112 family protein [Dokdonella sp.]|uniref:Trm112 family protein n=1 Tax=Dokdonella sp. TaxID=2291710 RepID=UPI0035282FFB
MDKHLLDILCCPQSKTPVRAARRDEIEALNRAVAGGALVNVAGKAVLTSFPDALITRDGKTVYRVEDDIPVMLADEAVSTLQLTDFPGRES